MTNLKPITPATPLAFGEKLVLEPCALRDQRCEVIDPIVPASPTSAGSSASADHVRIRMTGWPGQPVLTLPRTMLLQPAPQPTGSAASAANHNSQAQATGPVIETHNTTQAKATA